MSEDARPGETGAQGPAQEAERGPRLELLHAALLEDQPGTVYRLRRWDERGWEWEHGVRVQAEGQVRLDGQLVPPGTFLWLFLLDGRFPRDNGDAATFICFGWARGARFTAATEELYQRLEHALAGPRVNGHSFTAGDREYPLSAELFRDIELLRPDDPRIPPGAWPPTGPGGGASGRVLRERPATDYVPQLLPQQTFPEAKALAIGMADGPKLRRWKPVEGEIALWHQAEKAALKTKIGGPQLLDWLGAPATVESLREELRQAGLPSVLLLHTVLGASLERAEKNRLYVTVAVDDLITAIGWTPRSALERERRRRQVWRWLAILDSCQVIGQRPGKYRDPDTKREIDLTSLDALIRITGQRKPAQLAFDHSAPPLEVTYVAGPWIERWRGQRHILTYFGDVRKLAAIPAGKPSGAWAQAIGLALQQKWRERASYAQERHVGQDKHLTVDFGTFTRRELLDLFPPNPPRTTSSAPARHGRASTGGARSPCSRSTGSSATTARKGRCPTSGKAGRRRGSRSASTSDRRPRAPRPWPRSLRVAGWRSGYGRGGTAPAPPGDRCRCSTPSERDSKLAELHAKLAEFDSKLAELHSKLAEFSLGTPPQESRIRRSGRRPALPGRGAAPLAWGNSPAPEREFRRREGKGPPHDDGAARGGERHSAPP